MHFISKKNADSIFFILGLVIFLIFFIFTVSGDQGLLRLMQLKKMKDDLAMQNKGLMMSNLALRQEQKSLYDLETLKHQARGSLGLAYPNEVVFVTDSNK